MKTNLIALDHFSCIFFHHTDSYSEWNLQSYETPISQSYPRVKMFFQDRCKCRSRVVMIMITQIKCCSQNRRTFFQSCSYFAGRMKSGSCGPLSRFDVKKGRATIIVFRVISVGGTASSKSNDRTKENKMAFILIFPRAFAVSILPTRR